MIGQYGCKWAKMDIFVLGSGAGVLAGARNYTTLLVRTVRSTILLDAGSPIFKRLREVGIEGLLPSYIFISHYHHDHLGGIFMYLYELEARGIEGLPLLIMNESTAERIKRALEIFVKPKLHPESIVIKDDAFEKVDLDDMRLYFIPVRHTVPTHGVYLESYSEGKTLFYSSDTLFLDWLSERLSDCDVGFHEATIPEELEGKAREYGYHASPRQALDVLRNCKVKVLIHLSTASFKGKANYRSEFIAAEDGMIVRV